MPAGVTFWLRAAGLLGFFEQLLKLFQFAFMFFNLGFAHFDFFFDCLGLGHWSSPRFGIQILSDTFRNRWGRFRAVPEIRV